MNDDDIIERILSGDKKTLSLFYRTYAPKLSRFIAGKVSNAHDAEEILQDTLFAFLEALRDFHGKSSLQTFLFAICHHKIVDFYRKKRVKSIVFSQMPSLESLMSPLLNPEEELDATLVRENIHQCLERIVPRYRQVLLLKYLDRMSVEAIAEKLAITFKSAESLLFRARKAFVESFIST